jgi:acyl-CoA thioesterase-1
MLPSDIAFLPWRRLRVLILRAYGVVCRHVNVAVGLAMLAIGFAASPASASDSRMILALGDSLTAGYGLAEKDGFTRQLERALKEKGLDVRVANAGVSGDTTAGGRARLAWTLDMSPDLIIVELGANDGLRGIEPEETRLNLDAILRELHRRNIPVLLTGMRAPPNLGPEYAKEFDGLFPALAKKYDVPFYPFFLDGVAARPDLNQNDGIHPNATGVAVIVERILPFVIEALKRT